MDWAKKHIDTIIILGAVFSGFFWLNGKFNDIEKRLIKIETVMIMKNIIPPELLTQEKK